MLRKYSEFECKSGDIQCSMSAMTHAAYLLSMTSAQFSAPIPICLIIHVVASDLQVILLRDLADFKGIGALTKLTSPFIVTCCVTDINAKC